MLQFVGENNVEVQTRRPQNVCLSLSQEPPTQKIDRRYLYNKALIATRVVRLSCAFMTACPNT